MKTYFKRLLTVYIGFFLCLNLIRCASLEKMSPEYNGVDPRMQHWVKEYKEIAQMQGITFKHEVTVGFKKLGGSTVGLTTYGKKFREIDIDPDYFENSTEVRKETLIFHELTHGYCYRGHTWGDDQVYPEYLDWHGKKPTEGYYKDGCPLSLMFPVVLDDYCTLTHFGEYVVEMFHNCDPY